MTHHAFTGPRNHILTLPQEDYIRAHWQPNDIIHVGDSGTSDLRACFIAADLSCMVELHPCTLTKWQNYFDRLMPGSVIRVHPPIEPIARNHVMVDMSVDLIATSDAMIEKWAGSGTWATIRYARNQHRHVMVVGPTGEVREYNY